jgi:hyperpolarization activated cyclic nucleotide-gated potassium channel 2
MFLIFYEILSIPFVISFDIEISSELSMAITILFLIDIAVTFNTAVWIKGTINYQYAMIFKQYLKLWFWLDLAASFPYDMVTILMHTDCRCYCHE